MDTFHSPKTTWHKEPIIPTQHEERRTLTASALTGLLPTTRFTGNEVVKFLCDDFNARGKVFLSISTVRVGRAAEEKCGKREKVRRRRRKPSPVIYSQVRFDPISSNRRCSFLHHRQRIITCLFLYTYSMEYTSGTSRLKSKVHQAGHVEPWKMVRRHPKPPPPVVGTNSLSVNEEPSKWVAAFGVT